MFDKDLQELSSLSARQKALLRRAGLQTPAEVLLPAPDALLRSLAPTSAGDARVLAAAVAEGVAPQPAQLGSILRARRAAEAEAASKGKGKARGPPMTLADGERLTLGDGALDRLFGNGLALDGSLTEIVGESSAGKTQFALAFTVRAALLPPPVSWPSAAPLGANPSAGPSSSAAPSQHVHPPVASHAIYLSSEGHLPTSRLISLLPPSHADNPADVLSRIHFLAANDAEAVDHVLSYLVPSLLARLRAAREPGVVRLLVLDSLAAVLRSSFGQDRQALAKRSEAIGLIADKLKSLGVQHGFAIVVLNQVADVFGPNPWLVRSPAFGSPSYGSPAGSQGGQFFPSPAASQQYPPDLSLATRLGDEKGQSTLPFVAAAASYIPSPSMAYRDQTRYFSGSSATLTKEAALGLVWANAVSSRVMLRRTERFLPIAVRGLASGQAEEGEGDRLRLRQMTTVFSPSAEAGKSESYLVQTSRVVSVRTIKDLDGPASDTPMIKRPRALDEDEDGDPKKRSTTEAELERAKAARRAAVLGLLPASSFAPVSSSAASERGMT